MDFNTLITSQKVRSNIFAFISEEKLKINQEHDDMKSNTMKDS